jgi:predicted secreted Zn-dependent protease
LAGFPRSGLASDAAMVERSAMLPAFALPAMILLAPLAAQPASAPLALSQIPGVTVKYYDVSGDAPKKILASLNSQRPRDPAGRVVPSSARWSIATDVQKATTGNRCRIVRVTALFKAEVELPRLVVTGQQEEKGEEKLNDFLKRWQTYVAGLDQQQAAYLRAIHQRLPEVERAVMASSCEGARAAGEKAISEIKRQSPAPGRPPALPGNPPPGRSS